MNLDRWTDPQTNRQIGNTTMIGSPRGWVYRSMDNNSQDNYRERKTHPGGITIGGIWYRPCQLPDLGSYYSIIRYFELPANWAGTGRSCHQLLPVIGIGSAVPIDEMMTMYRRYQESGAAWVWASMPNIPKSAVDGKSAKTTSGTRAKLDHQEIYQLFDAGATVRDVCDRYDTHRNSIEYVYTKWRNQQPAVLARRHLDREAIAEDLRSGMDVQEIANKYETSRTSIYSIRNRLPAD